MYSSNCITFRVFNSLNKVFQSGEILAHSSLQYCQFSITFSNLYIVLPKHPNHIKAFSKPKLTNSSRTLKSNTPTNQLIL